MSAPFPREPRYLDRRIEADRLTEESERGVFRTERWGEYIYCRAQYWEKFPAPPPARRRRLFTGPEVFK